MNLGKKKIKSVSNGFRSSNADGPAVGSGSAIDAVNTAIAALPPLANGFVDYASVLKLYDDQITAQNARLTAAQDQLNSANNELANAIGARSDCDFTDTQRGISIVIPGSGLAFQGQQNKCLDENNSRQDAARGQIDAAKTLVSQIQAVISNLQSAKLAATTDNRTQQTADTAAQTARLKADAGAIVAGGLASPEVIAAQGAVAADAADSQNKKILYAGVILFIILAGLVGAYYVVSQSKSVS